jgi:large subunit ribosomal protein L9
VRVILRNDLAGLGKRGDIVDVADGHARNYLLPKGHAMKATDGAVSQAKAMRRARDLRDAADRESAQSIASALVARTIVIPAKAGSEGKLFGSRSTARSCTSRRSSTSGRTASPRSSTTTWSSR